MKANSVLLVCVGAILLALGAGCANPLATAETGTIAVSIGDSVSSRTLLPVIDMDPANYIISGEGPGDATFSRTNNSSSTTIEGLIFGTWAITVEARNASDAAIGTGTGVVEVQSGQTSSVNVTVRPFDGFGSLDLTVNWPLGYLPNPSIEASLLPVTGSARNLVFTMGSETADFFANDVQTGYHTLTLKLLDDGLFAMGAVEIVRIVKDQTTVGTFMFDQINSPGGNLIVNVTPEMAEPLWVNIAGVSAVKMMDQTMNLSASVSNYGGNVSYVWYLNADAVTTGPDFAFSSGTPGYYNVSVTAFSADGKQAGSASSVVQVTNELSNAPSVQQIFAGYDEAMIIKSDSSLWATGTNTDYRFGDGTLVDRSEFTQTMTGVHSVTLGRNHTMFLKPDGSLWAAGRSGDGEHGDGVPGTLKQYPVQVMNDVKAVSTKKYFGDYYTMILKTDNSLWATGYNGSGQLGDGTYVDKYTPVQIMTDVASVEAGWYDTLILKTDESLWAAGANFYGIFGNGTDTGSNIPIMVMTDVAAASMSSKHAMVLKTDGTLWASGYNYEGQLGDGTTTNRLERVQVMSDVRFVSAGNDYTMIVKNDSSLWATGDNSSGKLGDGTTINRIAPVQVMTNVETVAAGESYTLVLKTDGSLWVMGYYGNMFGNLSSGSSLVPTYVGAP